MEFSPAPRSNGKFARPKPTSRKGVRVVGKIRPLTESEKCCLAKDSQISMSREDNHASVTLHDQANGRGDTYILDGCYEQDESTSKFFAQEVKPLLQGILHGDNCCVIAYGAQGSGKTQLIQGSVESPGLAMMAFCEIISVTEEVGGSVAISCYEMYNDHIYDLLERKEQEVQVMEDAEKAIQLKGLSKIPVKSFSDFKNYYLHISNQRKVPQKAENDVRVRNHKGLIMYVTSVDKDSKYSLVGKLNFMDLAGYEEVRKRADGKASLSECNKINKSLYALLNVVRALNGDEPYIPYRETKLTRLLQDFLCSLNTAVLITCLSPSLCPHTFRAISLASRSCQFVNRQRHGFARSIKECRKLFPSRSPVGGIHPPDKTMIKQGIYGLGSSGNKIKGSSSTSNGRFQGHGSRVKKTTPSSYWSKERKLFNVASPLAKPQKLANLYNKQKSAGSNVVSVSSALKEENSPLASTAESSIAKKKSAGSNVVSISSALKEKSAGSNVVSVSSALKEDASLPTHHIHESIDGNLAIDMKFSLNSEVGHSMENGQQNSCFESSKRSPTLTEQLRELSNRFKTLSSQPISLCTSKTDGSCSMQFTLDSVEPETPRYPLSSKLDCNSIPESFATPQEKFKTRSTGLKKSLVNECVDFLNRASEEELKQLKGIGDKRATYILELREETPEPFKEIDDLKGLGLSSKQIKGMMSKILADI